MRDLGKVSVIITNHGRDISKVVDAINSSTYKNYEIIIVDEGLERSRQRNLGIERSSGEYILILDSDMLIAPDLLEDCVNKIQNSNGVYLPERIVTPGWFGRLRNWERQFYTATPVDCVRFVRRVTSPSFDETMSGPEDADWDRKIPQPKVVSSSHYDHLEDVTLLSYFKKKAYYAKSMGQYVKKHPKDKVLSPLYRCFWIFIEHGKWKRLFHYWTIPMFITIFIRGLIYLWQRNR